MKLKTKSELARLVKRSPAYIDKAIKTKKLRLVGKGRRAEIDLEDIDTIKFIEACRENDAIKAGRDGAEPDEVSTQKPAPAESGPDEVPDIDLDALAGILGANTAKLDRATLDRLKAIEQIRAIKQKTDQARLKLIDRALVAQAFAKIYAVDVNEFRTLGANTSPVVGSIAGVDRPDLLLQIEQAVNAEVFKVLGHVKRIINDFLKSIETEKLK